jgi:hypothetical protein
MKSNQTNEGRESAKVGKPFGSACVSSCKGVLAQIGRAKDAIYAEARHTLKAQDQMLRLALNEAEALAWQTMYPHLVFPALAVEKVQGVEAWNDHQRLLGRQGQSLTY